MVISLWVQIFHFQVKILSFWTGLISILGGGGGGWGKLFCQGMAACMKKG